MFPLVRVKGGVTYVVSVRGSVEYWFPVDGWEPDKKAMAKAVAHLHERRRK